MSPINKTIILSVLLIASPFALADGETDCLLKGTVMRGNQAGQGATTVKINSIRQYDEESRCNVRRNEKMEFKLPADPRVQEAEPGSTVKYRYRTESDGTTKTELVSVGT